MEHGLAGDLGQLLAARRRGRRAAAAADGDRDRGGRATGEDTAGEVVVQGLVIDSLSFGAVVMPACGKLLIVLFVSGECDLNGISTDETLSRLLYSGEKLKHCLWFNFESCDVLHSLC